MPQTGMLVQIDGSFHRWLGDDGPQFTLLLAVDDATSAVVNALFSPEEDTHGYFTLMQGLIERWGRPIALYGDRHGVFKFSGKPRHIQPPAEATHFSKAIAELGIQQIFARSPQAKGRVERAAGTFQDRLVIELRLTAPLCSCAARPTLKPATLSRLSGSSRATRRHGSYNTCSRPSTTPSRATGTLNGSGSLSSEQRPCDWTGTIPRFTITRPTHPRRMR